MSIGHTDSFHDTSIITEQEDTFHEMDQTPAVRTTVPVTNERTSPTDWPYFSHNKPSGVATRATQPSEPDAWKAKMTAASSGATKRRLHQEPEAGAGTGGHTMTKYFKTRGSQDMASLMKEMELIEKREEARKQVRTRVRELKAIVEKTMGRSDSGVAEAFGLLDQAIDKLELRDARHESEVRRREIMQSQREKLDIMTSMEQRLLQDDLDFSMARVRDLEQLLEEEKSNNGTTASAFKPVTATGKKDDTSYAAAAKRQAGAGSTNGGDNWTLVDSRRKNNTSAGNKAPTPQTIKRRPSPPAPDPSFVLKAEKAEGMKERREALVACLKDLQIAQTDVRITIDLNKQVVVRFKCADTRSKTIDALLKRGIAPEDIVERNGMFPVAVIKGVPADADDKTVAATIIAHQENLQLFARNKDSDVKFLFSRGGKGTGYRSAFFDLYLQVSPSIMKRIQEKKMVFGGDYTSYEIADYILVDRCMRCGRIGHASKQCRHCANCLKKSCKEQGLGVCKADRVLCCLKCNGNHLAADCQSAPMCLSCKERHGAEYADHLPATNKCATQRECMEQRRRMTNYGY